MTDLAPSPGQQRDASESSPAATTREAWYARPVAASVVLFLVLFALAQAVDPGGYLSTDVGGKTATLEVIQRDGLFEPDIGYWAEPLDPDGSLHPMSNTMRLDDLWVNVTTIPMIVAASPLYAVGGMRLAIALPVLGAVLAAAGSRALAERLGGDRRQQTLTFWVVGLASPATVYALDFWEHSLGLALMVWGVVAVLDASRSGPVSRWAPLAAGLSFAGAAAMRQEALVYGFVAGLALVVRLGLAGRLADAARRGAVMMIGTGLGLAANAGLEWFIFGSPLRTARSTSAAGAAGGDAGLRVKEAIISATSAVARDDLATYGLSFVLLALLVALGRRADEPAERQTVMRLGLLAVASLVALDLLVDGLRFIPGMLATTPLAGFGLARGWQPGARRTVTLIAIGALPLVWYSQYTGGVAPQWGGRYILTSGLLLLVVGVVSCEGEQARRTLRVVAGAGAIVTLVGVAWTIQRANGFADALRVVADRPEEVVIFENSSLARGAGPLLLDEQWLAASREETRAEAVRLLDTLGVREVGFVAYDDGRTDRVLPGWEVASVTRVPLVNGLGITVTTWVDPG